MKRVLTAIVLIAAVFALVVYGKLWMITLAAALIALLAAFEYRQLANASGDSTGGIPLWWMMLGIIVLFLTVFHLPGETLPIISALGLVLFIRCGLCSPLDRVLPVTAAGVFGLIYIGYPLTLLPMLWTHEDGTALVLFLMVAVWAGDIAALYIGRAFGKKKLAPRLSPGKTWVGSIASIAASVLAGGGFIALDSRLIEHGSTLLHISGPIWITLALAAVLNIAAQLGDLLESALKRAAGVKDSGNMLPGHGGILDRIDALLFAAPVLWFALLLKDAFGSGRF